MEYKFKQLKLSDAERLWLTEILKSNFLNVDIRSLKVKLRNKLPEDFNPDKIDNTLILSNHLTLIGLWHIDPQNTIFNHVSNLVETIKALILKNSKIIQVTAKEIATLTNITERDAEISLKFLHDLGDFFGGGGLRSNYYGMTVASFKQDNSAYDKFLRFKSLEQEMERFFVVRNSSNVKNKELVKTQPSQDSVTFRKKQFIRNPWNAINNDYDIDKRAFGKKINFVTDKHKKKIILRDIEQAYILADLGFSKPATILAGGVIEELLRLYLKHKKITPESNNFYDYIKTCEQKKLLKSGISRLSDSVRHFRNIVHISKEETEKYTLSKATSKSAVASIFIIANDF